MEENSVKVIEKYSMPFVQLTWKKRRRPYLFSLDSKIKQVVKNTGAFFFLKKVAVDESDKEKTIAFFQDSVSPLLQNFIQVLAYNHRTTFLWCACRLLLKTWKRNKSIFDDDFTCYHPNWWTEKTFAIPLIEKKMSLKVRSVKEQIEKSHWWFCHFCQSHKTIDVSIKQQLKIVKEK